MDWILIVFIIIGDIACFILGIEAMRHYYNKNEQRRREIDEEMGRLHQ